MSDIYFSETLPGSHYVCIVQYYLPEQQAINKDFLRDVLSGKKQLLRKDEVRPIHVPHYDELSVRNLYPQFTKDKEMQQYFPDTFPKNKGPPRKYFFDLLNTIHPEYLHQLMKHANEQRHSAQGEDMKAQSIEISQYWEEQLKAMPYFSCK